MRRLGVLLLLVAACDQTAFDPPDFGEDPPPGPGSPQWADTDLSCSAATDCAPGESCIDGTCRPKQCDGEDYASAMPLGTATVLFRDQELLLVDGDANEGKYYVDGYEAAGASYSGSLSPGSVAITDVAAIDTPDGGAAVTAFGGSSSVTVLGATVAQKSINTGLVPVAVAAGDVDGDHAEDIVAISSDAQSAICSLEGSCTRYAFNSALTGVDVAAGDTNGDGVDEVVFLLRDGDSTTVSAWSVTADEGGYLAVGFDTRFNAVTAGDVDHDGRDEVALLEDRGWFGFASDAVHVYRVGSSFEGINAVYTTGKAVDLGAGDVDGTGEGDAIAVLGTNKDVEILRWNGSSVAKTATGTAGVTASPKRIALGDLDNDSVRARLVSGPDLVPGRLMPTMVATFPPYDATAADGLPGVAIGSRTEAVENAADTVSLRAGIEVGVDADFVGLFKAKLSTKLEREVAVTRAHTKTSIVGSKFSLRPQVDLYGNQYAAVVVGCNCFHRYDYELIDNANKTGGSGRIVTMMVPVGGQVTVLSTPRYNALASLTGDLPTIEVASRIGDPTSYPRTPTKLDGTAVAPDEQVFRQLPELRTSDVGTVGFWLLAAESDTNTTAMSTTVSVNAALSAVGVTFGASLGATWGKSFSITVGSGAEFSGEVPPIPDNPDTPEDEYHARAFTFSPVVYRQAYTDPVTNEPSGYYVLDYTVTGP